MLSAGPPTRYLRSRILWPVAAPPLDNGALLVAGDTIVAVGRARDLPCPAGVDRVDLGDVVLMPGLVNAHCHLDYTHMAGQIAPQASFTDWIKCITALKGTWTEAEFRASWLAGADSLVRHGVTTVGDIEALPELLPGVWEGTPLRGISFFELTGVKSRRNPAHLLGETLARADALPRGRWSAGLSPHAPYSTVPELLRLSGEAARARGWRLTIHVAESAEEDAMFRYRHGPLYDWLERNERDMSDCGEGSPVEHLERCGLLGEDVIVVHANYLQTEDMELLACRGVSVAHCPRSHEYFGHRPFAWRGLERAGVNLCLGTDSLATVRRRAEPELNLFAEMREFARFAPEAAPEHVVRLATVNAARALGLAGRVGVLAPGAWADAIAVPFAGRGDEVASAVVAHRGEVAAVLIGGAWIKDGRRL
ncbi:MAG: amidohydrolase family protein [Verrucomicrobiales bacterium]|nr:amidohydrolase family protein [Verrucomicrobiales bacterium]